MTIRLPAVAVIPSDYVTHERCNGYHRVRSVEDANYLYPGANMVRITVVTVDGLGTYDVRRSTYVDIAFSGVVKCAIKHNSQIEGRDNA